MKMKIIEADPVKEVRRIREEIMTEFKGDLGAYCAYLRRNEGAFGRKVVDLTKRRKRLAAESK